MGFLHSKIELDYTLEEELSLGGSDCNAVRFGPMAYEDIEVLKLSG